MGQEIEHRRFRKRDFERFHARLESETALLGEWFVAGRFHHAHKTAGFELEAWLVDRTGRPAPVNAQFLAHLNSPLATPELARFNIELNGTPQVLHDRALSQMEAELNQTWAACRRTAAALGVRLVLIGILPTVRDADLCLANMSGLERYRALNQQVLRLRRGRPLQLEIQGREHLRVTHADVMLESAATSFQIHLQVGQAEAVRAYNAAAVLSAPMVAVSANSPYLFGRDLWDETRIPVFEQAVEVGGFEDAAFGPIRRVTFGSRYVSESLFECFQENLAHYPVLLPAVLDAAPDELAHLRLHNGTIWRWNRPLIGFDAEGEPHLRIEHRVAPAGPTVVDTLANAAFFYGALAGLLAAETPPESRLEFATARENFYAAARNGLRATVGWLDGAQHPVRRLVLDELLPLAEDGLCSLGLARDDIARYLGIVASRVVSGRNGAAWQRAWMAAHGRRRAALTCAYLAGQESGAPIHEWRV